MEYVPVSPTLYRLVTELEGDVQIEKYNYLFENFTPVQKFSLCGRECSTLLPVDDKVYIFGGYIDSKITKSSIVYHIDSGVFEQMPDMIFTSHSDSSSLVSSGNHAIAFKQHIYLVGRNSQRFDTISKTWEKIGFVCVYAILSVANGSLYATEEYSNSIYVFNEITLEWDLHSPAPNKKPFMIEYGGTLCAVGNQGIYRYGTQWEKIFEFDSTVTSMVTTYGQIFAMLNNGKFGTIDITFAFEDILSSQAKGMILFLSKRKTHG